MKYKKFNKYEKKEVRRDMIKEAMSGSGVYIYKNSSPHAELTLPRPTASGIRKVGPGKEFQGDDYYIQMVKSGELRLVKVVQTAEEAKAVALAAEAAEEDLLLEKEKLITESVKGEKMAEQKLIVEQPSTVTTKGTVEHVVEQKKKKTQPVRENTKHNTQQDVLLNEGGDSVLVVG